MMEDIYQQVKKLKILELLDCESTKMEPAVITNNSWKNSQILFCAIQPGKPLSREENKKYEDVLINSRMGKMFITPFLNKAKLSFEDIYWTNLIKLPAPHNEPPKNEWADACFDILQKQIDNLSNLKIIVFLGNFVADYLKDHPLNTKAKLIKFFHPSFLFRNGKYYMIDKLSERVSEILSGGEKTAEIGASQLVNIYYDNWNFKEKYRNGVEIKFVDKIFDNYFYILVEDMDKMLELKDSFKFNLDLIYDKEVVFRTIDGRNVIKIYCKFYFYKFTKFLKENELELFESDLSPYVKYVIDNKIKFSKNRRYFLLDIENDMCVTPFFPEKEITCIGIYDNFIDRYKIFTFNKIKNFTINKKCDVLVFNDEKEMLNSFINYFVECSPDIIGSWFGNDFDIPYIINRCKKLKLLIDKISNSDEEIKIKCELWDERITLKIGGVDCVDFMPVLQRVTGYMQQPSNYDLSSVCSFFLGDEYVKKDFNLSEYKEKFQDFLEYNFRDIELLKLLNDKMGLLNYILLVQSEIVPCTLPNITYNSYLLEMYLKLKNPEIVLLDKKKSFKIGEDIIDLKNTRVKIKGAFTGRMIEKDGIIDYVDPIPGVYENVEVVDFSCMYASLYSTYNLSLENLNKNGELVIKNIEAEILNFIGFAKYGQKETSQVLKNINFESNFNLNKRGLIPKIIDEVRDTRKIYKNILKTLDKNKDKLEYQKNKAMQDAFKVIGNAFYGVFSYNNFRLFNPYLNGAITKLARDSITFINKEIIKLGITPIYSDTDSSFLFKNGEKIDIENVLKIINEKLKEHVVSAYPKLKDWYCMEVEHAYSFKKLVFKEAKKRYFGILENGEFWTKGFEIIRRDTPKKIKPILKQLFIDLLYKDKKEMKLELKEIKKYLKTLDYNDLGITLTISRNLDTYKINTQHIRGTLYSVENFDKKYKSGDKVKLIFISDTGKYPKTDVICINDNFQLPKDFKIDYDRFYDFLIIKKLQLLEGIKEFDINYMVNENKCLEDYGI